MINEFYKEKTYAELILKEGFTSNNINRELKVLAKYFKEQGLTPKQRENSLYSFCNKYGWFKKATHYKLVDGAVNYSRKKDSVLVEIEEVSVSESEIEYIDSLDVDEKNKKLLFSLLIIDKLNKCKSEIVGHKSNDKHYFGGGDWSYKKLVNVAYVNLTNKELHLRIGELAKKRILRLASKAKIELLFIDNIQDSESVSLTVKDFDSIGLYYELHNGNKKVKRCEGCEVPIKLPNNNRVASQIRFCQDCKEKNRKEQNRIKSLKYYYNSKHN